MIKYEARITEIGPLVSQFTDAGILVFFGVNAPEELREFSIIHDGQMLVQEVRAGDLIYFGQDSFHILAVGEIANKNIASLGHFIVKFNDQDVPEMPGDICAEALPLPVLQVGMHLKIVSPSNC